MIFAWINDTKIVYTNSPILKRGDLAFDGKEYIEITEIWSNKILANKIYVRSPENDLM